MKINHLLPPLPPRPSPGISVTDDALSAFTSDGCSICLSVAQFSGREVTKADVYQIQCGHLYHTDCLSKAVSERETTETETEAERETTEAETEAKCPLCRHEISNKHTEELYCYGKALSLNEKLLELDEKLNPDTVEKLLSSYPTAPYPNRLIANLLLTALNSEPPQEDHVIEGWLNLLQSIEGLNQQEAKQFRTAARNQLLIALDQSKPDRALKWLAICPISDLDDPAAIRAKIKTQLQDAVINNQPGLVAEYIDIYSIGYVALKG